MITVRHHTKGPWKVYRDKLRPQFPTRIMEIQDASGQAIVAWPGFDALRMGSTEMVANARLMAGSPSMLAELELILDWAITEKKALRPQEIARIEKLIREVTGSTVKREA